MSGDLASRWAPWTWCWARSRYGHRRCVLRRGHLSRHAQPSGLFGIAYFDTAREGTP